MSSRSKAILLLLVDNLVLFFGLTVVMLVRKQANPSLNYVLEHYRLFCFIFPLWILTYFIEGLYTLRTYNPANLPISVIRGTSLSVLISIIVIYLLPPSLERITPKTNLVAIAILTIPILYLWRRFFFSYFARASRQRETLLIGSKETLELVQQEIERKPHLGYRVLASYTSEASAISIPVGTELIAVERNLPRESKIYQEIFSRLGETEVIDLAKFAEKISGKIPIKAIDESWFIEYCGHQESRSYDLVKGLVDATVALGLIVFLVPIAMILLPILLLVHGRPVFFKQVRTGLNNKPFTLYKLRTMVIDAEKSGAQWAKPGDARITRIGSILRKTRLDELPQLINILRGEMSLVGPRPERPEIIEKQLAPTISYYNLRHLVKPGVTGWAQVTFRYGFSAEDSKEKLQYDLFYVKNRSGWLDLLVVLKTIKTVLTGAGQ